MAEDVTYTNTYMAYWQNKPYIYPNPVGGEQEVYTMSSGEINTGWHIIPTILWKHFTTPKQWCNFMINYEAYTVKGYTVTIYNPIPMTMQLAIQGTTAFTAFNNTIYTVGAQDDIYETSYHNWYNSNINGDFIYFNLAFKEGQYKTDSGSWKKTVFPIYAWKTANPRDDSSSTYSYLSRVDSYAVWPRVAGKNVMPNGIFWDPFNDPDSIMELRPGKNAMSFSWNCHDCDTNKWYNTDQIVKWFPYTVDTPWLSINRGGTTGSYILTAEDDPDKLTSESSWTSFEPKKNDYTIPNLLDMPIVPMQWWWQEMQKSIAEVPDIQKEALYWAGTEYECYKYGPTQCFLKGIPLFDDNGTHIDTMTQGCVRIALHLACKRRRSRIFAPTWGPLSWRQVYSINAPRVPNLVRYRTGGARRTWTNINKLARPESEQQYSHREDPYTTSSTYDGTRTTATITTAKTNPYYSPHEFTPSQYELQQRRRLARQSREQARRPLTPIPEAMQADAPEPMQDT
uniref:Structural protein VP1 n=1 Tax=Hamaparvovirinae sp. TaxID=2809447 RepID=A0AAU7P184_9VIRU